MTTDKIMHPLELYTDVVVEREVIEDEFGWQKLEQAHGPLIPAEVRRCILRVVSWRWLPEECAYLYKGQIPADTLSGLFTVEERMAGVKEIEFHQDDVVHVMGQ